MEADGKQRESGEKDFSSQNWRGNRLKVLLGLEERHF